MSGFGFTVRSFFETNTCGKSDCVFLRQIGRGGKNSSNFRVFAIFRGVFEFFRSKFFLSFSTSLVVFPSNINQAFLTSPRFPASHQRPDSLIHPRLDPTRLAPRLRLHHFSVPNVGDFPGTLHFVGFFLAVFSVQFTPRGGFQQKFAVRAVFTTDPSVDTESNWVPKMPIIIQKSFFINRFSVRCFVTHFKVVRVKHDVVLFTRFAHGNYLDDVIRIIRVSRDRASAGRFKKAWSVETGIITDQVSSCVLFGVSSLPYA